MTTAERVKLIVAVADEIDRRSEDFLDAEVADTGKPRHLASHIDIPRGAANFRMFADVIATMPNESFTMPTPDRGRAINYAVRKPKGVIRSEEHTSELQSLMRISYAVICLKKKKTHKKQTV